MAAKSSKSFLEGDLAEKSVEELKERALQLFQQQRDLKESQKTDVTIQEHREYMKDTYSTPNGDIEAEIKVLRRVFRLRGCKFDVVSENSLKEAFRNLRASGVSVEITTGDSE